MKIKVPSILYGLFTEGLSNPIRYAAPRFGAPLPDADRSFVPCSVDTYAKKQRNRKMARKGKP